MDLFKDVLQELSVIKKTIYTSMETYPHYEFPIEHCFFCENGEYVENCDTYAYLCGDCKELLFKRLAETRTSFSLTALEDLDEKDVPSDFPCANCCETFDTDIDKIFENSYVLDFKRKAD